jgi:hypothetical protein
LFLVKSKYKQENVNNFFIPNNRKFDSRKLVKLFPELDIQLYENFPTTTLAKEMFLHHLDNEIEHKNIPILIKSINQFFNIHVQTGNELSLGVLVVNQEEEEQDININVERFKMVGHFIETNTSPSTENTSSTILYNKFKEYLENHKSSISITHTTFSKLVKQSSSFDTIRKSDGVYWINLKLKTS